MNPLNLYVVAPLVVGVAAALAFVLWAERTGRAASSRFWAIGLVVVAVIYVVGALVAGRAWLPLELGGLVLFAALAWAGLRSPALLALGWGGHTVWDLLWHPLPTDVLAYDWAGAAFMPWWYPAACLGFDLLVGGYLWSRLRAPS